MPQSDLDDLACTGRCTVLCCRLFSEYIGMHSGVRLPSEYYGNYSGVRPNNSFIWPDAVMPVYGSFSTYVYASLMLASHQLGSSHWHWSWLHVVAVPNAQNALASFNFVVYQQPYQRCQVDLLRLFWDQYFRSWPRFVKLLACAK